jgi:TAP-like protein
LENDFYDFLYNLKYNPVIVETTTFGYEDLKSLVFNALYSPSAWSALSIAFDDMYKGNYTLLATLSAAFNAGLEVSATPDAVNCIKCSDKMIRTPTMVQFLPYVEAEYSTSKFIGDGYVATDAICAQWRMPAKEIYKGDFQVKTKNPILFVSNTFDPITPLVSGKNMSSGFEGSALLEHRGYGVRLILSLSFILAICSC